MGIEIVITVVLIGVAGYIFYNKVRKKLSGECCCSKDGMSKKKRNK